MTLEVNETPKQMSITTTWKCHFFFTRIDNFTRLRCVYVWGVIRKSRQSGAQKIQTKREGSSPVKTEHISFPSFTAAYFFAVLSSIGVERKEGRRENEYILMISSLKLWNYLVEWRSNSHFQGVMHRWTSSYESLCMIATHSWVISKNLCNRTYISLLHSDFIISS